MGYSLCGRNERYFHLDSWSWQHLLHLARAMGWDPQGTEPPSDRQRKEWDGGYSGNDGQFVTDQDAANLADALAKALDDLPDHDALAHKVPLGLHENVNPFKWFSGLDRKRYLREFIAFCRQGGFLVF